MEARNFTQRSINASQLSYEHEVAFSNLTLYDSVELQAEADHAEHRLRVVLEIRWVLVADLFVVFFMDGVAAVALVLDDDDSGDAVAVVEVAAAVSVAVFADFFFKKA